MEVNTLVTHKKLSHLGIGCIAKVKKDSFIVNWGTTDSMLTKATMLDEVDTKDCKTLKFHEFKTLSIANSDELPEFVIVGNEKKHWVGIGWVSHGVVTLDDLKKYPRIVE